MQPSIARQYEALELGKSRMLDDLAGWSAEALPFRPAEASWSALDIVQHLMKSEDRILAAMELADSSDAKFSNRDRVRGLMLTLLFQTPFRVKVPASAKQVLPGGDEDFPALTERWAAVRIRMACFLGGLHQPDLVRPVFRHPVAGWMTVPRTLAFLSAHIVHHGYQLHRLRRSIANGR